MTIQSETAPAVLKKIMAHNMPREVAVPTMTDPTLYAPPADRLFEMRGKIEQAIEQTIGNPIDRICDQLLLLSFGHMKEASEGLTSKLDNIPWEKIALALFEWSTERAQKTSKEQ